MPVPKRYFKVSQEINHDPEMWELTETFGDRSLRIWLEMLSVLDRNHNQYKVSGLWVSQLANATKTNLKTVLQVVLWAIKKEWLFISGDPKISEDWSKSAHKLAEDWPKSHRRLAEDLPESHRKLAEEWTENGRKIVLCASNWSKYNGSHEAKGKSKTPLLSPPNPPSPLPPTPRKKKERVTLAMPTNWCLSDEMKSYGVTKGMTPATTVHEFEKCKHRHGESRFTQKGWKSQTWQTWVLNWVTFGAKQVPAQPILVSSKCSWVNMPCEDIAVPGSKYCQTHKDIIARQQAKREVSHV